MLSEMLSSSLMVWMLILPPGRSSSRPPLPSTPQPTSPICRQDRPRSPSTLPATPKWGYNSAAVFTFKNGTLLVAGTVATPAFSPKAGTYKGTQNVTIADTTPGASIYFTTDGTTPSASHGALYTTALKVSKSLTVKAIAVLAGCTPSSVASAAYTIQ